MITAMRKGATGWVAKILFVLLIISFGAWGIVDYLQPDPDPVVITVGDTEVRQSWVRSQFGIALDRLRERVGTTVTLEFALEMGLDDQVIDSIIDQQVLTREAAGLGLTINDSLLRAAIAQDPTFQGVTGSFDRGRYEQILFRSGLTESQFLQDLSGRLVRDPLLGAIVAAPPPPAPIVDAQYAFYAEERQATVLHRAHSDLPAPAAPPESTLRAFYDAEDLAYNLPELRDISAIVLNPEQIAANFDVSADRIAEEYENRLDQYRRPEERTIAQMVFQDADAASAAVDRLRSGESWVTVASDTGGVANELGSLTERVVIPQALAAPAFELAGPGYADPVETPFGHHVLWVKAIDPAETQPLAEVRDDILRTLAFDLAIDEMIERANAVEDTLAGGASLEAAADAAEISVQRFEGISRTGQTAAGERPEGLPGGRQFTNVAFQTEEGETSILTETPEGGYFVVRIDRVAGTTKRPFEQVRGQVLADWIEAQRADQAEASAMTLAETVRSGANAIQAAEAAGFEFAVPPAFARSEFPVPTTPDLIEAIFAAAPGEVIVHNDADSVFVARVDDVVPPSAARDDAEADQALAQLRQILDRDRRQEIAQAFQRAVRQRYEVEIDEAAIDRLLQ